MNTKFWGEIHTFSLDFGRMNDYLCIFKGLAIHFSNS